MTDDGGWRAIHQFSDEHLYVVTADNYQMHLCTETQMSLLTIQN